ncbi:MAG: hypothetical protein HRU20_19975 [Pseudomonadales bacterium]|nr:hypothetical protein [Pseudomonadales bacterium]
MSEESKEFEETKPASVGDADVFSRGSLTTTFELIRKKDPSLALLIRNMTAGSALPKSDHQISNKNADHFQVTLNSFQVRAVVETLMDYIKTEARAGNATGMEAAAKSLVQDWLNLASKMIAELPDNEKP